MRDNKTLGTNYGNHRPLLQHSHLRVMTSTIQTFHRHGIIGTRFGLKEKLRLWLNYSFILRYN